MIRAGGMIKGILKDVEADTIQAALGDKEGPEAVAQFQAARKAYAQQSSLKEALDERLHLKGSTGGYAKAIKEMANTDGETLVRRLSGVNDANMLDILQQKFPETAALVRNYHVSSLLKNGALRAKGDLPINSEAVLKTLNNMQPELRNFIVSPQAQNRLGAIGRLLDRFNTLPHNFSNTARTLGNMMGKLPSTAVGVATGILGHNPVLGALSGILTHYLGTSVPDAADYALLKFLGNAKNIDAEGFKAMADTMEHSIKGEQLLSKGVSNVFKDEKETLPNSAKPSKSNVIKLDKYLARRFKKIQNRCLM